MKSVPMLSFDNLLIATVAALQYFAGSGVVIVCCHWRVFSSEAGKLFITESKFTIILSFQ